MKKQITAVCAAAVMAGMMVSAGAANAVTATPTRDKGQTVYVDNTRVYPTGYNIADNNYFKLRDIGKLVGFGVDYDEATQTVEISTTRTAPSTEGITDTSVSGAVAKVSNQRIAVDGIYVNMKAYQIDGNNYVKLRDVGLQVDFGVNYDAVNNRVVISPKLFYGEEPEQTPTMVTDEMLRQWEDEMLDLINKERVARGLETVVSNEKLKEVARVRAEEITIQFSHDRPSGTKYDLLDEVGIPAKNYKTENIIQGTVSSTPNSLMNTFMASQGHCAWILSDEVNAVGIALTQNQYGQIYGVQIFGMF